MSVPKRVFLSHTSEFQRHPSGRSFIDAAVNAVNAAGHQATDMRNFPARDQEPSELCIERLQQHDIYVGIIGFRYGTPVIDRKDLSYTELEFDTATERELVRLIFLLHDEAEIPAVFVLDHEYGERQAAFRARLKSAGLAIRHFRSLPELENQIEKALRDSGLISVPEVMSPEEQLARRHVSERAAMAFVDIMRMFCVASSAWARASNKNRYVEFVDVAESHFSDLRLQVTRLPANSSQSFREACDEVEKSLSYLLLRFKRSPSLSNPWREAIRELHTAAERVHAIAELANSDDYPRWIHEAGSITRQQTDIADLFSPSDEFVRRRLAAQTAILAVAQQALRTIRDDMDHHLAFPYFGIDLAMLRTVSSK